ncbi:MAG: NAD(P)-binding protein [Nanoarchaeota archaeon]
MDKKEDADIFVKVMVSSVLLLFLIFLGAVALRGEAGSFGRAIYLSTSVITHTYTEPGPNAPFLFLLSLAGTLLYLYILYVLILIFFRGKFTSELREVRTMNKAKKMQNHIIVCGGGRVGGSVADALKAKGKKYIIVESDENVARKLQKHHPVIIEDALTKGALEAANIKKATAVVSCLGNDGDNVVQVIIARELNKDIRIIARANYPEVVEKLNLVGATEIIMPEKLGGLRMAELA